LARLCTNLLLPQPHEEDHLQMSFNYSPSKAYYLWYRIGGGGGHQLHVRSLEIHTIIHDSPGKWIGQTYEALESQEFLQFHNDFTVPMLRLIATVGQEENTQAVCVHLAAFLGAAGFDVSNASMKALEEIASALLEHEGQTAAHAALAQNRNETRRVGRVPLQNNCLNFVWAAPPMQVEQPFLNPFEDDEADDGANWVMQEEDEAAEQLDAIMEDFLAESDDDDDDETDESNEDESDEDEEAQ